MISRRLALESALGSIAALARRGVDTSPPNRPDPGRWRASRSVVRHELPGSLHRTSQNAGVIEPAKFIEFFVADLPLK